MSHELVTPMYAAELEALAIHLVTPERYGKVVGNVHQLRLVELHEAPDLYPDPHLPDAA